MCGIIDLYQPTADPPKKTSDQPWFGVFIIGLQVHLFWLAVWLYYGDKRVPVNKRILHSRLYRLILDLVYARCLDLRTFCVILANYCMLA